MGAIQHQLAQCPEDQEGKESAHRVDQDQSGPGTVEAAAGTHEEPGTDRTADGDHLDLPGLEGFPVTGFLLGESARRRFGG